MILGQKQKRTEPSKPQPPATFENENGFTVQEVPSDFHAKNDDELEPAPTYHNE